MTKRLYSGSSPTKEANYKRYRAENRRSKNKLAKAAKHEKILAKNKADREARENG